MVELHCQADSGIVECAELRRQMGAFDDAVQILTAGTPDQIGERGNKIMGWALAKDPELKMLGQNGY